MGEPLESGHKMAGQENSIQFDHVTHCFSSRTGFFVLNDVSFVVAPGERVCVAGPSGSGKTTLLNLAAGLLVPTSGAVSIGSRLLADLRPRELAGLRARALGLVFQSPNLIPVLSARENIDYALGIGLPEMSTQERRQRVEEVLALTGLCDKAEVRPAQLSGGECQRVALARAVAKRPKLLLADEPTSQLDDVNCRQICTLLDELRLLQDSTVLIATHDRRMLAHADRVLFLESGELRRERDDQTAMLHRV